MGRESDISIKDKEELKMNLKRQKTEILKITMDTFENDFGLNLVSNKGRGFKCCA